MGTAESRNVFLLPSGPGMSTISRAHYQILPSSGPNTHSWVRSGGILDRRTDKQARGKPDSRFVRCFASQKWHLFRPPRNDIISDHSISTLAAGAIFPTRNKEWLSDGKSPQLSIKITHSLLSTAPAFHSWKERKTESQSFCFRKYSVHKRLCWYRSYANHVCMQK